MRPNSNPTWPAASLSLPVERPTASQYLPLYLRSIRELCNKLNCNLLSSFYGETTQKLDKHAP